MTVIKRGDILMSPPSIRPKKFLTIFFILIAFVIALAAILFGFYFGHWHRGAARQLAHVLPLPAASVDGEVVWFGQVVELAAALETEKNNGDIPDHFNSALEMTIDRQIVEQLAEELNVTVTDDEVANYSLTDEDLPDFLDQVKWSENQYRKYVVTPLLLSQKVEDAAYESRDNQKIAYAKAESILDNIKLGVSFDDLAKQYSDDSTAVLGGYVGYWTKDDFDKGLESAFDLEVGEVSDILKADDYYAIIKVNEIVEEEGERSSVGAQIITVNKDDLSVVLEQYRKGKEIKIFVQ